MNETAVIGLGGNVGDVQVAMVTALELLDAHSDITVTGKSALYKTPPWGDADQDWFLNACASLETSLSPKALLDVLKRIESKLQRVQIRRWGPRTIDLDILFFSDCSISDERLQIPHPRMHERAFVLLPLLDVASDRLVSGELASHWLECLDTDSIVKIKASKDW